MWWSSARPVVVLSVFSGGSALCTHSLAVVLQWMRCASVFGRRLAHSQSDQCQHGAIEGHRVCGATGSLCVDGARHRLPACSQCTPQSSRLSIATLCWPTLVTVVVEGSRREPHSNTLFGLPREGKSVAVQKLAPLLSLVQCFTKVRLRQSVNYLWPLPLCSLLGGSNSINFFLHIFKSV